MPNLFPEGFEDEIVTAEELVSSAPIGYKGGASFDYESGDFVRDGRNHMTGCSGVDSWKQWCVNTLQTERYRCLAYSTDIGLELSPVFQATSRGEAESILVRQITEALMADPYQRTAFVERVDITWPAPDAVKAYVLVHGIQNVTIDFEISLAKGV